MAEPVFKNWIQHLFIIRVSFCTFLYCGKMRTLENLCCQKLTAFFRAYVTVLWEQSQLLWTFCRTSHQLGQTSTAVEYFNVLNTCLCVIYAPTFKPSSTNFFPVTTSRHSGSLCRRTSRWRRHWLFCGKSLKTHLFSHSFPQSCVVPVQWLHHFE